MGTTWLSYSLADFLMFGPEVFLRLFVRINQDIWPWQGVAVVMVIAIGTLLVRGDAMARRSAPGIVVLCPSAATKQARFQGTTHMRIILR